MKQNTRPARREIEYRGFRLVEAPRNSWEIWEPASDATAFRKGAQTSVAKFPTSRACEAWIDQLESGVDQIYRRIRIQVRRIQKIDASGHSTLTYEYTLPERTVVDDNGDYTTQPEQTFKTTSFAKAADEIDIFRYYNPDPDEKLTPMEPMPGDLTTPTHMEAK